MFKLSIAASVLVAIALAACNSTTTTVNKVDPPPSIPAVSLSQLAGSLKTEAACSAKGGKWGKVGMRQQFACELRTNDAGKACTDSSQCQVACIVVDANIAPSSKVTGQCYGSTLLFGCRAYVRDGKAEPTLCAD